VAAFIERGGGDAIHHRRVVIKEDEFGPLEGRHGQPFLAVGRLADRAAERRQESGEDSANRFAVIDGEDLGAESVMGSGLSV
jgi:hypothetical protein